MVRNIAGGSKAKGQARKFVTAKATNILRISQDESEIYAQVIQILGGSMCHVSDVNGKIMLCHIRGKFRGRGKRDNFVSAGTWVLVGIREWETSKEGTTKKLENCDLLEVYNDQDKERLKNTVTTVNWSLFVSKDIKTVDSGDCTDSGIEFSDEKTDEYRELFDKQIEQAKLGLSTSIIPDEAIVDIDDI